jgi:hypothetical protein
MNHGGGVFAHNNKENNHGHGLGFVKITKLLYA